MADPFEVRLKFTSLLAHLSASQTSSVKTAAYALKHRDMDEDLHSCILENLEHPAGSGANAMNNRANIMYFLEHFCDMAVREKHEAYVDMVRRDMRRIVTAVVGEGSHGSGTNIKVARKIVSELGTKGVLGEELVYKIELDLRQKEEEKGNILHGVDEDDGDHDHDRDRDMADAPEHSGQEKRSGDPVGDRGASKSGSREARANGVTRLDRKAIEQRIEEDRERNKRLRESVWAVDGDDEHELDRLWDEESDLSQEDYVLAQEEADERVQFARYHKTLLRAR